MLGSGRQVIIAGVRDAPDTKALVDAAFRPFAPGAATRRRIICLPPALTSPGQPAIPSRLI